MCVGVTLWFGWGGLVSGCRLNIMINMFRMFIHSSSGASDLFVELFHGLYCSGTLCVGVTLWFGWGGVVSGCRHISSILLCCSSIVRD